MMTIGEIQLKRVNIELDIERQLSEFAEELHGTGVYMDDITVDLVDVTSMDNIQRRLITNIKIKLALT